MTLRRHRRRRWRKRDKVPQRCQPSPVWAVVYKHRVLPKIEPRELGDVGAFDNGEEEQNIIANHRWQMGERVDANSNDGHAGERNTAQWTYLRTSTSGLPCGDSSKVLCKTGVELCIHTVQRSEKQIVFHDVSVAFNHALLESSERGRRRAWSRVAVKESIVRNSASRAAVPRIRHSGTCGSTDLLTAWLVLATVHGDDFIAAGATTTLARALKMQLKNLLDGNVTGAGRWHQQHTSWLWIAQIYSTPRQSSCEH